MSDLYSNYIGDSKSDIAHYGRKGMKRGMNIFNPDYVPIGEVANSKRPRDWQNAHETDRQRASSQGSGIARHPNFDTNDKKRENGQLNRRRRTRTDFFGEVANQVSTARNRVVRDSLKPRIAAENEELAKRPEKDPRRRQKRGTREANANSYAGNRPNRLPTGNTKPQSGSSSRGEINRRMQEGANRNGYGNHDVRMHGSRNPAHRPSLSGSYGRGQQTLNVTNFRGDGRTDSIKDRGTYHTRAQDNWDIDAARAQRKDHALRKRRR